jgi:hypothetical protein
MTREKIFELACITAAQHLHALQMTKQEPGITLSAIVESNYNDLSQKALDLNINITD